MKYIVPNTLNVFGISVTLSDLHVVYIYLGSLTQYIFALWHEALWPVYHVYLP